ncbi:MAG: 23S rRNA (uridine2552-2'-O)-methyltransferase [Methylophilaceae bacterium]|jgi:23S rRNA (uridine2552-2'-O)-methyltransferase
MKLSNRSKAWMQEHLNDEYVKRAQKEGYRARAAYKLMEIDDKDKLIRPRMTIVDLGSSPGSWCQVAKQRLKGQGRIIGLDLLDMHTIAGVEFIQGDFREESVLKELEEKLNNKQVDLVIADMAPNISGVKYADQAGAIYLIELALEFSQQWLKPNGNFLVKVFMGAGFDDIVKRMRSEFDKVVTRKPKASRGRSNETYLLGLGRK